MGFSSVITNTTKLVLQKISIFSLIFFLTTTVFAQAPSSAPASSGTAAPATTTTAPSSTGTTTTTTSTSTDKGKAAATTSDKGKTGVATEKGGAQSQKGLEVTEDAELKEQLEQGAEEQRQKELTKIRKKIFGSQIFNNENLTFTPNTTLATPRDYTIGPGDELLVYIYGFSQQKFTLLVNSDGFVFMDKSIGGAVQLAGRTIEQAQKELIQRLSPHYVGLGMPNSGAQTYLQITLGRIRTIRVTVLGEVITPGTYSISSLSTALNALHLTGGPNELGSFRDIKVIRKNQVVAKLDLYELLMKGSLESDIRLQDNDVIQVDVFQKRIELKGNFKRPGIYELLKSEPLAKAIHYAGGFTQDAYSARLKVIGITPKEKKITDVSADDFEKYIPSNGDETTAEVILNRFQNMVTIMGAIYRPGQYSLDQNKSLLELISNADGLRGDAFLGRINITRTREDLSVENITLNLNDIYDKKVDDLLLKREDLITIPSKFELREGAFIRVTGELNKGPVQDFPYTSNLTLEDIILSAGGFRESAAASHVDVVRRKKDVNVQSSSAQIADIFTFNISRDLTLDANESRFVLEPFDEVIVRNASNYQPQTFIVFEGEVVGAGTYGLKNKDEKLSDLLVRAGGLTAQAYVRGATLIRKVALSKQELDLRQKAVAEVADDAKKGVFQVETVEKEKPEAIGINLEKILENPGGKEDIILQDGDIIRIPKRLETVRVQGELLFPTTVKYSGGNFIDYISRAGGFTRTSLKRKSYVIYPNGSVDRTRKFLFFNKYPHIEPGSEIIVPVRTASDLAEAQKAINSIIGISQTFMVLVTTVLAFKALSK